MQVKCTSCGAQQNVVEAKNCDFCGNIIELESAKNNYQSFIKGESGNLMSMAETAIEATNWDEALQFFNRVLEKDITNSDAWLGKGIAIVYTSKIGDLKTTEAIAYWKNALKHAPKTEAMGKRVAKEINEVVNKFYPTIENHFIKFKDLENSYDELVSKFVILEKAQDYATQLDSSNIALFETGYALCRRVIEIPKKYAMADSTSAMAGAIIGGLQQNKYKQQDAINQSQKARARKNEIEAAAILVLDIELKYIDGIKKINPLKVITPSNGKPNANDDFFIQLVTSKYRSNKNITSLRQEVKKKYNLTLDESTKLVNTILLENNLITQDQLNKEERIIKIMTWLIIAGILSWVLLAMLGKN
jgi:hypothetical protein